MCAPEPWIITRPGSFVPPGGATTVPCKVTRPFVNVTSELSAAEAGGAPAVTARITPASSRAPLRMWIPLSWSFPWFREREQAHEHAPRFR
ncbi:hypothetical protein Amsp01_016860 [Amycolatopsis sp. NBRC 101858]|nr:hypothetical protein Amsp01_016860 [Amycolatopsis sp. NBRC 101858]